MGPCAACMQGVWVALSSECWFGPVLAWVCHASMPAVHTATLASFPPQQQLRRSPQVTGSCAYTGDVQAAGRGAAGAGWAQVGRRLSPACGLGHTPVSQHKSVELCCSMAWLCCVCVFCGPDLRSVGCKACEVGSAGVVLLVLLLCSLHCLAVCPHCLHAGFARLQCIPHKRVHKVPAAVRGRC